MSSFTVIDLSKLPAPKVVEELDYENLLREYYQDFLAKDKSYDALLESDPAMAILQAGAYREMLIRQRINECAKANLLAYATGSDLDQKAASYGVSRLEDENDDRLRYRCQLSLEGYSTAGPVGAYIFHALSANIKVKSISVESPKAGEVLVTVLSTEGNGTPDTEILESVEKHLNDDDIRPLTDLIKVQPAEIIEYSIEAVITVYQGPSFAVVENQGRALLEEYVAERHTVGGLVALSGIHEALHTKGVKKVEIITPKTDITTTNRQAPYCKEIKLKTIIDYDISDSITANPTADQQL